MEKEIFIKFEKVLDRYDMWQHAVRMMFSDPQYSDTDKINFKIKALTNILSEVGIGLTDLSIPEISKEIPVLVGHTTKRWGENGFHICEPGTPVYKLPKDFGERWVTALRSGEFPQGRGNLKNDAGYCCLGVACVIEKIDPSLLFGKCFPSVGWLPEDTLLYIKGTIGEKFYSHHLEGTLASMNDSGKTFLEIADWIEANVEFY